MLDAEDNFESSFSPLDKIRVEGLEIGEKMESECDSFAVHRYKDEYILFINRPKFQQLRFQYLDNLTGYLKRKFNNDF